jgi:DNA-binding NarL/FixJ family response regulator
VHPLPHRHEEPPAQIRVLVCDPVPVRRTFVRDLLEREPAIVVIDEFTDLQSLQRAAEDISPDVVIIATAGTGTTDAALVEKVRQLATRRVLVLGDGDARESMSGRVVLLPRRIGPAGLVREVTAALRTPPARGADHVLGYCPTR